MGFIEVIQVRDNIDFPTLLNIENIVMVYPSLTKVDLTYIGLHDSWMYVKDSYEDLYQKLQKLGYK